ncbi:MAG TPA: GyrI-like domain-containing protein [Methanocella sp.]|uniref:GyrI-like domain-containing protein n=1 Tax=Methanocella sp. TaxID=2052833 RepID=UPI002D01CF33|nr:GyrI-like domain-containing protein [Methanocella sp.]HTY89937.1 GyrI-like domain-containing protein [Methanocella sp.]
MFTKCEIKDQPAQTMMSIRMRTSVTELPNVLGKAFGDVAMAIGEQGQQPIGPPFVAYYNMDMQDLDIEVGFPVTKKLQARGNVKPGDIPAGKVATCIYTGPYGDGMKEAYEALTKLVEEKKQVPTGVAYEIYFNSPMDTPPEKLRTQIVFPLKST